MCENFNQLSIGESHGGNKPLKELSLIELCTVYKRSEIQQNVVEHYFEEKYPELVMKKLRITLNNGQVAFSSDTEMYAKCFSRYIKNVEIDFPTQQMDERVSRFMRIKCGENVNKIKFRGTWSESFVEEIQYILRNVEIVDICTNEKVFKLLKYCPKLKYLKLDYTQSLNINFPVKNHSIKIFELRVNTINRRELIDFELFLNKNPNIQRVTCGEFLTCSSVKQFLNILKNRKIKELFLVIRDFHTEDVIDVDLIRDELQTLNDQEKFERLELQIKYLDNVRLKNIDMLTSLNKLHGLHLLDYSPKPIYLRLPIDAPLNNLKVLHFDNCIPDDFTLTYFLENSPYLEELYFVTHKYHIHIGSDVLPFVQYFAYLNKIVLLGKEIIDNGTQIPKLNKVREKLKYSRPETCKVVIYFDDRCGINWADFADIKNNLVELKRIQVTSQSEVDNLNPIVPFSYEEI